MTFRRNAILHIEQLTAFVDNKGGTHYTHFFFAILFLFLPHAIGFTQLAVGVRQQVNLQVELVDKGLMTLAAVFADTENHRVMGIKLLRQGGELVGFDGAAGSVIFGVEIQHDIFTPGKIAEFYRLIMLIDAIEIRCGAVGL